jgi:group I intron endonuclease
MFDNIYPICYDGFYNECVGCNLSNVIYLWTENNIPVYIGQTRNRIFYRTKGHLIYDEAFLFQSKLRKRPENFKCYVIDASDCLEELNSLEVKYIKMFNTFHGKNEFGYNLTTGGDNYEVSDFTKKKLSMALSGKNHPMFGKNHTNKTKQKMSRSAAGRICSIITRKRMSEFQKNRKHSILQNKNISKSLMGRIFSKQTRRKMSLAKPVGISGYRGVYFITKRKKFLAYIYENRKRKCLGYYQSPIEASNKVKEYEHELYMDN